MEMISIAKFKPLERQLPMVKQYLAKIESLLNNLLAGREGIDNPFMEKRVAAHKIAFCVIASDTGLCGMYNDALIDAAEDFIASAGKEKIVLIPVGRKALLHFKKKGVAVAHAFTEVYGRYSEVLSDSLHRALTDIFLSGEAGQVHIAYTRFKTATKRTPVVERFLPISPSPGGAIDYIFEPGLHQIIEGLIPLYLRHKIRSVLLEAFGSEHSSRMIAMGEATENGKELLKKMILLRNKVRQAAITKEIMEISSSAEALR